MRDVCPVNKEPLVSVEVPLYVTVIPVDGATIVVAVYVAPVPPIFLTQMYPFALAL
jgi:hypothetical protein